MYQKDFIKYQKHHILFEKPDTFLRIAYLNTIAIYPIVIASSEAVTVGTHINLCLGGFKVMNTARAIICIDNGFFSKVTEDLGGYRTDILKFCSYIAQKCSIDQYTCLFYDCMPYQSQKPTKEESKRYSKKDKFISSLKKKGVIPRMGRLQKIDRTFTQKRVDTLWTADICKAALKDKIDAVVAITGDSDFVPGIEVAKEAGVHTVLWGPKLKEYLLLSNY